MESLLKNLDCSASVKENDDKPPKDFKVCLSRYVKASFNPLNKYKTSNYLMSVIEKKIAQNKGYNDALFVNEKNLAVETTSGNFFWIKELTYLHHQLKMVHCLALLEILS